MRHEVNTGKPPRSSLIVSHLAYVPWVPFSEIVEILEVISKHLCPRLLVRNGRLPPWKALASSQGNRVV